jgi:hypothetical protein
MFGSQSFALSSPIHVPVGGRRYQFHLVNVSDRLRNLCNRIRRLLKGSRRGSGLLKGQRISQRSHRAARRPVRVAEALWTCGWPPTLHTGPNPPPRSQPLCSKGGHSKVQSGRIASRCTCKFCLPYRNRQLYPTAHTHVHVHTHAYATI